MVRTISCGLCSRNFPMNGGGGGIGTRVRFFWGVSLEVFTLFKEDTLGESRDTLKLIELLFNHFSLALFGVSGCCHQCSRRILWKRKLMSPEILTEFSIGIFLEGN